MQMQTQGQNVVESGRTSPFLAANPSMKTPRNSPDDAVQYIPHSLFNLANAEQAVFGEKGISSAILPDPASNARTLLTIDEEKTLFIQFNYCRMREAKAHADQCLRSAAAMSMREISTWRRAALDRRDRLVECNLGLVPMMARKLRAGYADYDELVSEGNMALLNAVDKFDIERGFRFSTYACEAIHHAMVQAMNRRWRRPWMSLDGGLDVTTASSDAEVTPFDDETSRVNEIVHGSDANLTRMELQVIHSRFALQTTAMSDQPDVPMTRDKIGRMVGLSKERIRQIEHKALAKIRRVLKEIGAP